MAAALLLAATDALPLRVMQWLKVDGGADAMVKAVAYDPGVCLISDASLSALEGEVLFHTPAVLGGQAAKAQLSCSSCHVNGGDNPHFHFSSASGAPGTADVSNSFFSAAGSNGTFDPVLIPDLSQPGKVSRTEPGDLERFLNILIVTEFAGLPLEEPSLNALADYIRSLERCNVSAGAAPAGQSGLSSDLDRVARSVRLAERRLQQGDREMARLLVAGARDRLGLIHERYAGAALAKERASIEQASITLRAAANEADSSNRKAAFHVWHDRFGGLIMLLRRREKESLYNPVQLRAALN